MFLERRLQGIIELFMPDVTDPKTVLEMVPHCRNHVKRLDISQLLPPLKEEVEYGSELTIDNEYDGVSMDHFDFGILLDKLTGLEELHLVYRVQQCGLNFEWKMFEMTARDCESLAKALKSCKTLKVSVDFFSVVYVIGFPLAALSVWSLVTGCNSAQHIIYRNVPNIVKQHNLLLAQL